MFSDLRHAWRLLKTAILVAGVLLSGFAALEVLRAYLTLRELHRWAGYGFLGLCAAAGMWLIVYFYVSVGSRPRVLIPPRVNDPETATDRELDLYWTYLMKYLERLSRNPSLSEEERTQAETRRAELEREALQIAGREASVDLIRRTEEEVILPLLRTLDEQVEKQVRHSVRDIMLAVALSPYRAVDLLVVLYRNAVMIVRVIRIYNSRPLLREQLLIFKDTLSVVAAVNFLSFGEKFTEQIFSRVPFVGQILDDLIQGVGAGLLTSATGHAAQHRCRSFRRWNEVEAAHHMTGMMADFLADTRDLFIKDVLPRAKPRLTAMDAWDRVSNAFSAAFAVTGGMMETFVAQPLVMGSGAVTTAGKATVSGIKIVGKGVFSLPTLGARAVGRTLTGATTGTASSIKRLFSRSHEKE